MTVSAAPLRHPNLWRFAVLAFVLALLVNAWPMADAKRFHLAESAAAAAELPSDVLYKKSLDHPWTLQARVQIAKVHAVAAEPPARAADILAADCAVCRVSVRILAIDRSQLHDERGDLWLAALPEPTGPPQA